MHRSIRLGHGLALWVFLALVASLSAKEEKWLKIETPYFTLYSEGREKETRDWAAKFEQFRLTIGDALQVTPTKLPPVQVLIFRSDTALDPFKPRRNGRKENVQGLTINSPVMTGISMSFEGDGTLTGFGIFYGGARWFLSGVESDPPAWFSIGLAEVFSTYETQNDEALVGGRRKQHLEWIAKHGFMPMEQFLSIEGNALPPVDDDLTKAYQAQCWVLVHYLLFDRGAESAAQVGRYLSLCGRMPAPGAFAQAFGTPLENMKENLRRYMHGKIQRVTRVKFDRAKISQDFKLSAASAVEVEAAKGYVLLLNGDHDGARTYFERAKAQSPDDPKPLEALGDLALLSGDLEEAGRKWEAAAGAGSRNFNVYFQLAMALIRGNPGFTSGRAGDINPQLARKVANYLERAINLNPYYIQSFTYLPLVLGYYAEPTAEDPRFLELGLQLRPGDPLLEAGLAAVAVKAGRVDEARQRLARLTAADRTTPSAATALANSVQTRLQFADDLNQVEVLIADKKLEEAERLITTLLRAPMPAEIRLKLGQRLTDLGGWQVLQQVDRAMAEARWADAEILVRSLAESAPDPSLQAQAKTRLEEIIRQRAGKKI